MPKPPCRKVHARKSEAEHRYPSFVCEWWSTRLVIQRHLQDPRGDCVSLSLAVDAEAASLVLLSSLAILFMRVQHKKDIKEDVQLFRYYATMDCKSKYGRQKIQLEMESQIMESNVRTKCVKSQAILAMIPKALFQGVGRCLGARPYDTDPRRSVA
jgi:hypothetical protein